MLLTADQIREIKQIIADHHTAFVVNAIGKSAVSAEVLERLKAKGLIDVQVSSIEDAYLYGQVLSAADDPKVANLNYEDFKAYLKRNPLPLSPIEQHAVTMAEQQAAQYVVGLGNRIDRTTGETLIEADAEQRRRLRDVIKTQTAENVAKREAVKKLKSDLGWATGDWSRDWDRIAITEKHRAMQRGVTDNIGKRFGGEARIALRSMPDCCPKCAFLTLGPDKQPLIFKLSDLEANGTNYGKKADQWLPVVPPQHPFCVCMVVRVPKGWGFNEEGQLVPGGELGKEGDAQKSLGAIKLEAKELKAKELKAKELKAEELKAEELLHKAKRPKVARAKFQGLDLVIENPAGSVRRWKTDAGETGQTTMQWAYGYIEGTLGADGDGLDVFVGPEPKALMAYVVHQQDPRSGLYDEDKAMLGFSDAASARAAYLDHYDSPDFLVTMSMIAVDQILALYGIPEDDDGSTKLVIAAPELKKAQQTQRIAKEFVDSGPDMSPGPGLGVNVALKLPRVDRHPMADCVRVALDELLSQQARNLVKRDMAIYDIASPLLVIAHPITIPDAERRPAEGEVAARRRELDEHYVRNLGYSNRVDVGARGKLGKQGDADGGTLSEM